MTNSYTFTAELLWEHPEDDELDVFIEVEACFGVEWGYPATGPSYACGGEPGAGDSIIDVEITKIAGWTWREYFARLPFGLTPLIAEGALADKLVRENFGRMIDSAEEDDEPDWDSIRESREEDARYWAERQDFGGDYD